MEKPKYMELSLLLFGWVFLTAGHCLHEPHSIFPQLQIADGIAVISSGQLSTLSPGFLGLPCNCAREFSGAACTVINSTAG